MNRIYVISITQIDKQDIKKWSLINSYAMKEIIWSVILVFIL